MNTKPLQYASLTTVLQYIEPNLRFQISSRCPSIRKTERAVPLYINSFMFVAEMNGPNIVLVNSTCYSVGTIRNYPLGVTVPYEHDAENRRGGVESDLDKFGIKDYTSESHLSPGDILVGQPNRPWRPHENQYEKIIRELEALDMLLELKREEKPFILDRQHPQFQIMQVFKNRSIEDIRMYVRQTRNFYEPYFNERNNTTVPYTTEVQITVKSDREEKKVYRYPGRKLYQVEKKLLTLFFGSRKHIHVKSLDIFDAKILRFPVDMLIKIQHLCVPTYTFQMFDAISQFAHPTGFPLETVKVSSLEMDEIQHAILKSAKKLIFAGLGRNMPTLLEVATHEVEVVWAEFDPEDYLVLARNWLETRRTAGTCYVFNIKEDYAIAELMRLLETELNAEAVGAQCLKVRINDTSKLSISYQKVEEKWRMQFEVISE